MKSKKCLSLILAAALSASMLTGCGSTEETTAAETTTPAETTTTAETTTGAETSGDETSISYLDSLDENGHFKGVRALDYVTLPEYTGIVIDFDTHNISEDEIQAQIDSIMSQYAAPEQIMDAEVKDGDTVNIDYVGSVDGVEFEGGSTGGYGTSVTIGVTSYIDDFLEQLIGHKPGETINVEVTFPENYGNEELNGKDAVFVTTINYIAGESIIPEFNDEFVAENLEAYYGWKNVQEVKDHFAKTMKQNAEENFLMTYLLENTTISEVPEIVHNYAEESFLSITEAQLTATYGMTLDDYLAAVGGSKEEYLTQSKATIDDQAQQALLFQAIAEDMKLDISEDDIKAFFLEAVGSEDYTAMEDYYGIGYIKNAVISTKVLEHVIETAVRAEQ